MVIRPEIWRKLGDQMKVFCTTDHFKLSAIHCHVMSISSSLMVIFAHILSILQTNFVCI